MVIYFDEPGDERHYTVVTARKGPLARRRIVRGRESECIAHYRLNVAPSIHRRPTRRRRLATSPTL